MPDQSLGKRQPFGFENAHLGTYRGLEGFELVVRESHEERFQQDDRFPKTSIQVVMSGVNGLPFGLGVQAGAARNLGGGSTKIVIEIIDHLAEGADLMEKLGALAEQDAAEQAVEERHPLSSDTLEIGGVEWGSVGDGTVMFGVLAERPKQRGQRVGEPVTEIGCYADRQAGLDQASALTERERLI